MKGNVIESGVNDVRATQEQAIPVPPTAMLADVKGRCWQTLAEGWQQEFRGVQVRRIRFSWNCLETLHHLSADAGTSALL